MLYVLLHFRCFYFFLSYATPEYCTHAPLQQNFHLLKYSRKIGNLTLLGMTTVVYLCVYGHFQSCTRIQRLIYLHLFTTLFRKDFSLFIRTNTVYFFTKISEINLSAFCHRLCHEDFSSIIGTNTVL